VFRFELCAETEAHLPHYKGSTLRGAFGHRLKRLVCIRADLDCEACLVRPQCAYTLVFETLPPEGVAAFRGQKYAPRPFILEPPSDEKLYYRPGERLCFGLTLIGRAVDYLPYVIYALDRAGHHGLGRERGRFVLQSAYVIDAQGDERLIYDGREQRLAAGPFALDIEAFVRRRLAGFDFSGAGSAGVKLRFMTPVRIRVGGDLQGEADFSRLARSLLRRIWQLMLVHGGGPWQIDHRRLIERAGAVRVVRSELRWLDWERYSHRQRTAMRLGGFVGEVVYGGPAEVLSELLPLFILGELLHVGAGTTFGLGKYEVEPVEEASGDAPVG